MREHIWYPPKNHDMIFRYGAIKDMADVGLSWLTREGLLYQYIRYCETDGDDGFLNEPTETLAERFYADPEQARNALRNLKNFGLIECVGCDRDLYRGNTHIWASTKMLKEMGVDINSIRTIGNKKRAGENILNVPPRGVACKFVKGDAAEAKWSHKQDGQPKAKQASKPKPKPEPEESTESENTFSKIFGFLHNKTIDE